MEQAFWTVTKFELGYLQLVIAYIKFPLPRLLQNMLCAVSDEIFGEIIRNDVVHTKRLVEIIEYDRHCP